MEVAAAREFIRRGALKSGQAVFPSRTPESPPVNPMIAQGNRAC
jgi:hypothetical protein